MTMNLINAIGRSFTIILGVATFEVVKLNKPLWFQFIMCAMFVFACIIDTDESLNKPQRRTR